MVSMSCLGMAAVSEALEPRGISRLLIDEERCRGILKGREFTGPKIASSLPHK